MNYRIFAAGARLSLLHAKVRTGAGNSQVSGGPLCKSHLKRAGKAAGEPAVKTLRSCEPGLVQGGLHAVIGGGDAMPSRCMHACRQLPPDPKTTSQFHP